MPETKISITRDEKALELQTKDNSLSPNQPTLTRLLTNRSKTNRKGVYLRHISPPETCLQGFINTMRSVFCDCCNAKVELESDEPPNRHIYLGKQKEFKHTPAENAPGKFMQRAPHNDEEEETTYVSNYISTMKYNPYLMPAQNLFEQLQRTSNAYFFVVALISLTPMSTSPPATNVAPLVVVLGITMVKEIVEDWNRYKMDEEQNQREVDVWNGDEFISIRWEDLKVGDAIRITDQNPTIPADILLLQSSEGQGLANIETSNLDGETNLKAKQAPLDTAEIVYNRIDGSDFLIDVSLAVTSEAPNEKMGHKGWAGSVTVEGEKPTPLSMNSLVLRGCSLRNTDWIIALVIFTGKETKVMLNNKEAPTKTSHLDNQLDIFIAMVLGFQLFTICLGALCYPIWRAVNQDKYWYMYIESDGFSTADDSLFVAGLKHTITFLTLMASLVPISLYVTVEMAKMMQTLFIGYDHDMRYVDDETKDDIANGKLKNAEGRAIWARCRTTALNDEIGRINWVFSDKTGTLTRNEMSFLNCYVCGSTVSITAIYTVPGVTVSSDDEMKIRRAFASMANLKNEDSVGLVVKEDKYIFSFPCPRGVPQAEKYEKSISQFSACEINFPHPRVRINHEKEGKVYGPGEAEKANEVWPLCPNPQKMPSYSSKECRFEDTRLAWEAMSNQGTGADLFLTALSTCHTVVPEDPENPDEPFDFKYQAASPDEKALVIFAKNLHYYFHDICIQSIQVPSPGGKPRKVDGSVEVVRINGQDEKFETLAVIEFNSSRKRQSTILRDPRDGKIKLFCKGADNIILQRLTEKSKAAHWEKCERNLGEFAKIGLRTLCIAYKELSEDEFCKWYDELEDAKNDINHKEERVPMVEESIENDLTLIGATAIEDRLQEGVPDTIAALHCAGLNIWVLTGDKVETAINIGRSCRLIKEKMKPSDNSLFVIDIDEKLDEETARKQTIARLKEAEEHMKNHGEEHKRNQGLVLSGRALGFVFPIRQRDAKGREIPPTKEEQEKEEALQKLTLNICRKCSAVLCCRVSPKQKGQMVELVKYNESDAITLAIGDGANDVPMIKAAHVGIGIKGHEGVQAVMASDYAVGQFRYLQVLLFKHGAWNYRRLSKGVLYFFLKNITVAMTQLYYAFFSVMSGVNFWDFYLAPTGYNLVFTAFPVLLLLLLDRPYSRDVAMLCPEIYLKDKFNYNQFYITFARAVFNAFIIFIVCTIGTHGSPYANGTNSDLVAAYTSTFTAVLTVVTIQVALDFTIWHTSSILLFVASWGSWLLAEHLFTSSDSHFYLGEVDINRLWVLMYSPQIIFGTWRFWGVIILATGFVMVPELILRYAMKIHYYDNEECLRDMAKDPKALNEFLELRRQGFKSHVNKKYDPDVEQFKGYVPTHADRVIATESYAKFEKVKMRAARRYARSMMDLGINDYESDLPNVVSVHELSMEPTEMHTAPLVVNAPPSSTSNTNWNQANSNAIPLL